MISDDVIIALYPLSSNELRGAPRLFNEKANEPFVVGPSTDAVDGGGPSRDDDAKEPAPGETPQPLSPSSGHNWQDGLRFEFRWNHARKNQLGFVIGGAKSMCDIVVPTSRTDFRGVSAVQGLITFDDQNRLIYRDVRDPDRIGDGSAVTYDGRGGEKRRGFSWILSGSEYLADEVPEIVLHLHNLLKFRVFVPAVDRASDAYKAKVAAFRSRVQQSAVSDLPLQVLSFQHNDTTALPSGLQTMGRGPILLEDSQPLGNGTFGLVTRMYNVTQGIYFARKKPIGHLSHRHKELWDREIRLLMRVEQESHLTAESQDFSRYVVQMLQGSMEPSPFVDLEYVPGGTLHSQHAQQRLSGDEVLAVLEQVLKALTFLHGLRPAVCHRDVKPGNILVQHRSFGGHSRRRDRSSLIHVKLADFGLSKDQELSTFQIGTRRYMAPELYLARMEDWNPSHPTYTLTVDIWAVGVMIFELAHGLPRAVAQHRSTNDGQALCERIIQTVEDRDSDLAIFVARHMVLWEPKSRLSARECLARAAEDLFSSEDADTARLCPPDARPAVPLAAPSSSSSGATVKPIAVQGERAGAPSPSSLQNTQRPAKHTLDVDRLVSPTRRRRSSASVRPESSSTTSRRSRAVSTSTASSSSSVADNGSANDDDENENEGGYGVAKDDVSLRLHLHDMGGDPQASFIFGGSSASKSQFSELPRRDGSSGWPEWEDSTPTQGKVQAGSRRTQGVRQ